MFSLTRRYPLFRKLVIAVFSVPLMFFGGAFVGSVAQEQTIGAVGEMDISREEFYYRFQSALEDYRRRSGDTQEDIPAPIAEEIARSVRGELVSYYLMKVALEQKGLHAPDTAVAEEIRRTPDFQDGSGEFSPELYQQFVTDRRAYQERVREGIEREALLRTMNALPPTHIYEQLATFRQQQRVVDEVLLPLYTLPEPPPPPADDIQFYYQSNAHLFRLPEEADFEYFVLALDDFAATTQVSEEEVQAAYDDFRAEQETFERRRASHIYITDAAQAEEVAAQAIAAPAQFAALAAQHSEDAFSAENGGAMGIFAVGDLPPELDAALFTLQPGQVHEPVETEQGGYSILKLDEVINEAVPPLAEVREAMTQRAKRLAAQDDFDAKVDELQQLAPVEIGSMQAMADAAGKGYATQVSVRRDTPEDNPPPFNDPAALAEAFDEQITRRGENSAPIPLGDDMLFLRVVRYQSAGVEPLEVARPRILAVLRARQLAAAMRRQVAAARLLEEEGGAGAAQPSVAELVAAAQEAAAVAEEANGEDGAGAEGEEGAEDAENATAWLAELDASQLLQDADWGQTQTLAIASAGAGGDEAALNSADGQSSRAAAIAAREAQADADEVLDSVFAADLSYGLPAYVFVPQKDGVRVFRLREIINRPPQAQDYLVVEELVSDLATELSAAGYLDVLNAQYEYEFYNMPDLVQPQAN